MDADLRERELDLSGRGTHNRSVSTVGLWAIVAITTAWVSGCNAHIKRFDVTPRHICPGDPVSIDWEVTGSPTLTVTPKLAGAPDGPVSSSDRVTIRPIAKTRVSLRVTRLGGEPAGADVDVDVPAPVEIAADLNDAALCKDGVLTLVAHVKGFSPGVMAKRMGDAKRPLDIGRLDDAGKIVADGTGNPIVAHLEQGEISRAFAAFPVAGDWRISSPLGPGESCGNPPHSLTLFVFTECREPTP
jgi:hypothetical protein